MIAVRLRPIETRDMNQLRSWRNSPWVRENSVTQHIIGEEEHRVWFGRQLISPRHVARVIVADGVDVGLVTLTRSLQVGDGMSRTPTHSRRTTTLDHGASTLGSRPLRVEASVSLRQRSALMRLSRTP